MSKYVIGCLSALVCLGCSAVSIIDEIAEPAHIYHSGADLLSGTYDILPNPGDADQEKHRITLHPTGKGWELSQPDAEGFALYELAPDEMATLFGAHSDKAVQCAKTIFMTICAAPEGTRSRDGTLHFTTGYIIAPYSESPKHAVRVQAGNPMAPGRK